MLKNLKVGVKIGGGFLVVLALTIGLAWVAWSGLGSVVVRIGNVGDMADLTRLIADSRDHEKSYIIKPNAKDVEELNKNLAALKEVARVARDQKFKDPANKRQMDDILAKAAAYEQTFTRYLDAQKARDQNLARMRAASEQVVTTTEAMVQDQQDQLVKGRQEIDRAAEQDMALVEDVGEVVEQALLVRRAEKDYQLRGDEKFALAVQGHLNKIQEIAAGMPSRTDNATVRANADQILAVTDAYRQAFKDWFDSRNEAGLTSVSGHGQLLMEVAKPIRTAMNEELAKSRTAAAAFLSDKLAKADDANQLLLWYLEARKAEKEIIISEGEDKYVVLARDRLGKIKTGAADLKVRFKNKKNIEQIDDFTKVLGEYEQAFDQFVQLGADQRKAQQDLDRDAEAAQAVVEVAAADQEAKMRQEVNQSETLILGALSVAVLLGLLVAWLITRGITGPVRKGVAFAASMAEGDLTARIDLDQHDELGQLAAALSSMGDKLRQVVADVRSGVDNLASASNQVSATAQTISQGATEQAAGVEETTSSVDQLNSSVQQNSENARVTAGIATNASAEASRGGEAVSRTVSAMREIAGKIGLIEDIAYKTNLLSLNAAIEAARAGEHGKGFTVVAAEVRKLAENSRLTAQSINQLATDSLAIAEEAGRLLQRMVPNIGKTADLVEEITAASGEQSSGIAQISNAMSQLDKATQQNAAASEELAATSEELAGQAEQLRHTMAFFKMEDGAATGPRSPAAMGAW